MLPSIATLSVLFSRHTARWMRLGARQAGVKFALLFRLGSASGATDTQGLFIYRFHDHTMQDCPGINWSIVIISFSHRITKDCAPGHERSILTSPQVRLR